MMEKKYSNDKKKSSPREELYDYICKLFKIVEISPLIENQLNKMFKEEKIKMTYQGIQYTLYYFFEIKENVPDMSRGIGIVPYIYKEAKEFYEKKQQVLSKSKKIKINKKEKTVYINPDKKNENKYLIDMENL